MSSSIDTENGNTSPWDSDLATAFEDEATREAVSEFLGEKVQPYVTKLEQESKPDRDATVLWEQFHEEPVATTIQVIKELYGPEKAEAFADILQGSTEEPPTEGDVTKPETNEEPVTNENTDTSIKFEQLPPEVQEVIQAQKLEESRKAYYSEIDRIATEHADELPKDDEGKPKLPADTFHPFVVAADGDFDAAYEGFQKWIESARSELGVQQETSTTDTPPPTIDSRTRDASQRVPEQKKHQTIDGALDEMFDELKAPPPTVGAV